MYDAARPLAAAPRPRAIPRSTHRATGGRAFLVVQRHLGADSLQQWLQREGFLTRAAGVEQGLPRARRGRLITASPTARRRPDAELLPSARTAAPLRHGAASRQARSRLKPAAQRRPQAAAPLVAAAHRPARRAAARRRAGPVQHRGHRAHRGVAAGRAPVPLRARDAARRTRRWARRRRAPSATSSGREHELAIDGVDRGARRRPARRRARAHRGRGARVRASTSPTTCASSSATRATARARSVLDACDAVAYLPLLGRVGSLNVATATAIALYEARRQGWTRGDAGLMTTPDRGPGGGDPGGGHPRRGARRAPWRRRARGATQRPGHRHRHPGRARRDPNCDPDTGQVAVPQTFAALCVRPFPEGGDNGGATARGVTATTVKVVGVIPNAEQEAAFRTRGQALPRNAATGGDGTWEDAFRDMAAPYERFYEQWGRTIEWDFYTSTGSDEAAQRADAIAIVDREPFAALVVPGGIELHDRARRGRACSCSGTGTNMEAEEQPPYRWGAFATDTAAASVNTGEFVAKALAGRKAQWAGDEALRSKTRTFATVFPAPEPRLDFRVEYFDDAFRKYAKRGTPTATPVQLHQPDQPHERVGRVPGAGPPARVPASRSPAPRAWCCSPTPTSCAPCCRSRPPRSTSPSGSSPSYALLDVNILARTVDQRQWAHAFGIGGQLPPVVKTSGGAQLRHLRLVLGTAPGHGHVAPAGIRVVPLHGHPDGRAATDRARRTARGMFAMPKTGGAAQGQGELVRDRVRVRRRAPLRRVPRGRARRHTRVVEPRDAAAGRRVGCDRLPGHRHVPVRERRRALRVGDVAEGAAEVLRHRHVDRGASTRCRRPTCPPTTRATAARARRDHHRPRGPGGARHGRRRGDRARDRALARASGRVGGGRRRARVARPGGGRRDRRRGWPRDRARRRLPRRRAGRPRWSPTRATPLGRLDIAVNNIGNLPPGRRVQPFVEYRGDDWRDIVDQNLTMAALCARAEAEAMLEQGEGGVILFVSSGETTRPSPLNSIYAAAKAGDQPPGHVAGGRARPRRASGCSRWRPAPRHRADRGGVLRASTWPRSRRRRRCSARSSTTSWPGSRCSSTSDLARCITGQLILADAGAFLSRSRPALPFSHGGGSRSATEAASRSATEAAHGT